MIPDDLSTLKQYLTVVAEYSDGTTRELTKDEYILSGTLSAPSSAITVTYGGFTDTFTVLVTHVAPVLTGITATFTQGSATIYDTDDLNDLKQYLTVVASYSDSTTRTLNANEYTLSGTLVAPSSTITVSFEGQTDTFTVQVTQSQPLPYDSKVEYLASDGNAYIDTGISIAWHGLFKCIIDMVIPINALTGNQVVHGFSTTAGNWFGQSSGKYGSGTGANSTINIGQRITVTMDYTESGKLKLYIDGNYIGSRTGTIAQSLTFKLFKNGNYTVPSWIYSFKVVDSNDNIVRDCFAVRVGTVGYLYDTVSDSFLPSNGTFAYGADV